MQFAFEVRSVPKLMMDLEVTTSSLAGQDGTLANDFRVSPVPTYMTESDAFPGTYTGKLTLYPWEAQTGTLYFQASAKCFSIYTQCGATGTPGGDRFYIGPVHHLTVLPSPPAPAPQPPSQTPSGPTEAQKRWCSAAVRKQAVARRSFNAKRRAFRNHRTRKRKRAMNQAKYRLLDAKRHRRFVC